MERATVVVAGVALLIGLAAGLAVPFDQPYPIDLAYPQALLDHGRHASTAFYPTGYMPFVLGGLFVDGHRGVMLLQVLTYTGFVTLGYATLRLLTVPSTLAAVGALLVGLDPQFLLMVNRITDLNLVAPLLVAFLALSIWIRRDGLTWPRAILLGLTIGAMYAIRGNLLTVVPVALILIWPRLRALPAMGALAAVPIPILLSSSIMLGHPVLAPSNGPYTFAQGANAHTESALWNDYNSELSLTHYLGHFHVTRLKQLEAPSHQHALFSFGTAYIGDHPAGYAKLAAVKLVTFLRPDLRPRHNRAPLSAPEKLGVILSALPVLLWLAVALAGRGVSTAPLTTRLVGLFAVLYLVPFLLTNADPRYRYPLDAVLLLHAAAIAGRWVGQRWARSDARPPGPLRQAPDPAS